MHDAIRSNPRLNGRGANGAAAAFFILACVAPALAVLGGDLDTVKSDQVLMRASAKVLAGGSYQLHELKTANGTVIREFLSPAGRVFGVAWDGPFIPDMRRLLGAYFDHYSSAAQAERARYSGHRPLNIQDPNLVVQTGGHMRAYYGRAYDPNLLPTGVSADEVR